MTEHFNRQSERSKRKALRNTAPKAERVLWQHLRGHQLGARFRRQYGVDTYVLDFYAARSRLAIEIDGDSHFTAPAEAYDRERTAHLNRFGIEVLRFTNCEVFENIESVLARIQAASEPQSNRPGPSFGTLDHDAADRIEGHLTDCARCRQSLLDWSERAGAGVGSVAVTTECPDAETLVAYGAATLDASDAAEVERHLHACACCVRSVQHSMILQWQMERRPASRVAAPFRVRVLFGRRAARGVGQRRLKPAPTTVWPRAALAAAAVLVLAIGITRFIQPSNQLQEMHARSGERVEMVEITTDTPGRARPSADEPVVVQVVRGTQARWLEASGEWTRIELADGRRVWVRTAIVGQVRSE